MMLKRILTLFQQDLTNAVRDNLVIYLIVAPLLLALGARLFLPSLGDIQVTFAVERQVEAPIVAALEQFGRVELYDSAEAVQARVERLDDVPGIIRQGDSYVVLLEGNEPDARPLIDAVMQAALAGPEAQPAAVRHVTLSDGRSLLTEYAAMTLIMLTIFLGALAAAFIMVDEKETGAIRALAVAPLRLIDYTLARGLFAMVLSLALVIGSTLILVGTAVDFGRLLIGFLFSAVLAIVVGYLVGGFADNQLSAIAIVKVLMAVFISLPIISIFVPRGWHWLFYPLPNYWMWTLYENVFVGQMGPVGFWGASLLTLGLSLVALVGLLPLLRRRMRLRA
jgi:ABC-2 type transport system permease protein